MIEKKIDELIAAMDKLTAALGKGGTATKSSGGSKSTSSKKSGPTQESLSEIAGKLLKGSLEPTAADGKAFLKAFIEHFGFKPSETPDDKLEEAHAALTAMGKNEDPFSDGDDASDMV